MRLDRRLFALAALVAVACAGPAPDETEPAAGDVHVYEVRGQVTAVPDPADPLSNLRVRHEPIPHFVSIDGDVVGMDSMNMPFPVTDGIDTAGLAVGDKVRMTFEVDWDGDVPYQATKIEKLPAETELDFSRPADAPPDDAETEMETDGMEMDGAEHDSHQHESH